MQATRRRFLRLCGRLSAGAWAGLGFSPGAFGQIEDLLGVGRKLLEQGEGVDWMAILRNGESGSWEAWLKMAAEELRGDYVLDLAELEEAADWVLPLMERNPETRGYASWLRARMDYFDVAEFFRGTLPQPRTKPGQPPAPPMTPTPEQERRAWKKQMEDVSAPKGASTWVPRLKPVFGTAGAPKALVWLAEVESSFDPQARSPVGATGLYQLMPKTAQELGLKIAPTDERLVAEKNAKAAATYLVRLRRQFGDWPLALAAYNAGPGRVSDTLKRRRARSFDAIAPDLPAETQMYVPKFEAVLQRREKLTLQALKATG